MIALGYILLVILGVKLTRLAVADIKECGVNKVPHSWFMRIAILGYIVTIWGVLLVLSPTFGLPS